MNEVQWKKTIEEAASNFKERRTSERHSFVASAALVDLHSNSRLAARTGDIDRGGCYIDTLNPLTLGTTVKLRLSKENQSFKAHAKVVYVHTGNGMGLAFTDAEAEELQTLDEWIEGLDAAMAPNTSKSELPQSSQRATAVSKSQQHTGKNANERETPQSLMYLILLLVQKKILSEIEGKALLGSGSV